MSALVTVPIEEDHQADESVAQKLLRPILGKEMVMLRVNDPKVMRKNRVADLLLCLYLVKEDTLLISMPGYGSELCSINSIKPRVLMRTGLSHVTSKVLSAELNKLFLEQRK